jgi:hypothetical protein
MKYTYCNLKSCEKCEEKSNIFYETENIELCPRCRLEHLSFNFSSQSNEEIKFYIADIIFHQINEYGFPRKAIAENTVVDYENELSILEQRKKRNQNCDLFIIANKMLEQSFNEKNFLKRRQCSKCSQNRFHLIKVLCCKKFICIQCILQVKKRKCMMCQTEMYKNKKELYALLKITCFTILKALSMDAIEDFMDASIEQKMVFHDKKTSDLLSQVRPILDFYVTPQHRFPWKRIWEPESEVYDELFIPGILKTKFKFSFFVAIQTFLLSLNSNWSNYKVEIFTNFVSVSINIILCILIVEVKSATINKLLSKKAKKIHRYVDEIEKVIMIWLSYLVLWWARDNFYLYTSLTSISVFIVNSIGLVFSNFLMKQSSKLQKYQFY